MSIKRLVFVVSALLHAVGAAAQTTQMGEAFASPDAAWASYRDVYRLMLRFEKYGKPKQLIQNHLQVVPKDRSAPMDGVRIILAGRSMEFELPLDATGRAVFPMSKAGYDENAKLVLNRKAGTYALQPRVSIVPRADGIYDTAELRAACEQVLNYLRDSGNIPHDRKCLGVVFSFPRGGADPAVRFRAGEQSGGARLRVDEGGAFLDDSTPTFRIVVYQFGDWPERGQIITQTPPIAVGAVIR